MELCHQSDIYNVFVFLFSKDTVLMYLKSSLEATYSFILLFSNAILLVFLYCATVLINLCTLRFLFRWWNIKLDEQERNCKKHQM
jgi:hypothetical protein